MRFCNSLSLAPYVIFALPLFTWRRIFAFLSSLDIAITATDEAVRLRAALRMQGEEDTAKFRHLLLRELSAERERLQRVLDSKVLCSAYISLITVFLVLVVIIAFTVASFLLKCDTSGFIFW